MADQVINNQTFVESVQAISKNLVSNLVDFSKCNENWEADDYTNFNGAVEALERDDFDSAFFAFKRLTEVDQIFEYTYAGLALCCFHRGQLSLAETFARQAVVLNEQLNGGVD